MTAYTGEAATVRSGAGARKSVGAVSGRVMSKCFFTHAQILSHSASKIASIGWK